MKQLVFLILFCAGAVPLMAQGPLQAKAFLIENEMATDSIFDSYLRDVSQTLSDLNLSSSIDSLFLSRTIVLSGEINNDKANIIQGLLLYFDQESYTSDKAITLFIISAGGGVYAANEADIIRRDCSSDFWLTEQQALEYGLIDKIQKRNPDCSHLPKN